jgi:hypothetical protein
MMLVNDTLGVRVFVHRKDRRRPAAIGPQEQLSVGPVLRQRIGPPQDRLRALRQFARRRASRPEFVFRRRLLGVGLKSLDRLGFFVIGRCKAGRNRHDAKPRQNRSPIVHGRLLKYRRSVLSLRRGAGQCNNLIVAITLHV